LTRHAAPNIVPRMLLDVVPLANPDRTTLLIVLGGIGLLVLWLISRARRNRGNGAEK